MKNKNVETPAPAAFHSHHLAVFIGRFQPFHKGHLSVVEQALEVADTLVILVGSCGQPRNTFNPFTFDERREMILGSLCEASRPRVHVLPIVDHTYNDDKWIVQVQEAVIAARDHFGLDYTAKTALVGHSKDHTSFYLKMFPQWASVNVPGYPANDRVLSATDIRQTFFNTNARFEKIEEYLPFLPDNVATGLRKFSLSNTCHDLIGEFEFVERYKEPFKTLPYPPVFVTVDAVVVQSGHVLLVERRARPGKGLWAMPGGFLNPNEHIEDAVFRELREETKIKVPEPVLRGSVVERRVFDHPHRSARGRTITHAFHIALKDDTELPRVKGSDDAAKAFWVPIGELRRDQMFEDHYCVLDYFLG